MSELAHELLRRVLSGLAADVRESRLRVIRGGEEGGVPDEEAVHDFRVTLRRLRTLLRIGRPLYGERGTRSIGDDLGRIADATGALREGEVLRQTLADLELGDATRAALTAFDERRRRAEHESRTAVVALLRGDAPAGQDGSVAGPGDAQATGVGSSIEASLAALDRRLARGLSRRAAARPPQSDRELAHASLRRALADVDARAQGDVGDVDGMHELRIRFKRLRYTAELFAPIVGDRATAAAKAATRMQKRLGELHDLDEALVKVVAARGLPGAIRREVVAALRLARAKSAVRCLEELASAEHALARLAPDLADPLGRDRASSTGDVDGARLAGPRPRVIR